MTLNDIGIIAQNKIIYLPTVKINLLSNPLALAKINAKINIMQNKYILDLFNSKSNMPIFILGVLEFILALVSFPV